jgi:predicted permease
MGELISNVRYAARALLRNPGFALVVILTLGLGIGANTAIFTLLDQVLLRPLPVKAPAELVLLDGPGPFSGRTENNQTFSYPMYRDLRDRGGEAFGEVLARYGTSVSLSFQTRTERATAEVVSGNYFRALGVGPSLGRVFSADDERVPGGHPFVVLGHGYWQRRFGGDPGVVGQSLRINATPMTVVGVGPEGFAGIEIGRSADLFVPIAMKAQLTPTWDDLENRRSRWLNILARLRPGVSRERAETVANVVYRQILAEEINVFPEISQSFRERFLAKHLVVLPGHKGLSDLRSQVSTPLVALMGMVGLVLLVACANVANLLMARATARQKELAIRLSLGAGRGRIVRQLLTESVLLSLLGGAAGVLLAVWTGELLLRALPFEQARRTLTAQPDLRVGVFTLAVALLTGIVFGLAPALQATRPAAAATLKQESTAVVGGTAGRLRRMLVVAQVALSLLLLVGAGLFARSLNNLRRLDPGFEIERLLVFSVDPSLSGYDQSGVQALVKRLEEDLRAQPGTRSVAASQNTLLTNSIWRSTVRVEGYTRKDGEDMSPQVDAVSPPYFQTLGIPIMAGRSFTEADAAAAPKVAIVNETFARYFYGKESPLGRRFGFARDKTTDIEIVGVVKDGKAANLRDPIPRFVYLPLAQSDGVAQVSFYVRTALPEAALAPAVREAVGRQDAQLPVFDLKAMETQVGESLFVERMVAALSAAFGLLATLLASVGLYGVTSYSVARRTREIGIRMALGAPRGRVMRLILSEVCLLGAAGLALGLPLALGLAKLLRAQFFNVSPFDPLTVASATALLSAVTLAAGFVPARRAMRVDPLTALHYE